MVNSTLKSTFARRNHKERAQPLHRQRLGILEKHKDYVHRARDYKSKQDRIRKLREKAAFRNKDEFYWGMVKGKTQDGVAIADRGNEALSTDAVRLLKTQDVGYIRVQIAKDQKTIERLRRELEVSAGPSSSVDWSAASEIAEVEKLAEMGVVLRPQGSSGKGKGKAKGPPAGHVVFVDEKAQFDVYAPEEPMMDTPGEAEEEDIDLGWIDDEPKKKGKMKATSDHLVEDYAEEDARDRRIKLLTTLSAHLARVKQLRQAEEKLQTTKGLMGKGAARKIRESGWVEDETQPEDRNGDRRRFETKAWKWKLERKR